MKDLWKLVPATKSWSNVLHLMGGMCSKPMESRISAAREKADSVLNIRDAWCLNAAKVDEKCFPDIILSI